ncbi:MAG: polysaccharide deacetylase family protein [Saprospiraceae bacterium]|nr:polysaccharide deacetylase family protein [Saprospiraceae bacterium]MCB0681595.1 polysaccharide deacetylase family protein [Saprospiraceae bacterium]
MTISAGIGILSYNRPKSLDECLSSLYRNLPQEVKVAVSFDLWDARFQAIATKYPVWGLTGERPGIPHANNRLLRFLSGFDAVFLVQDDVRFLRPEWLESYLRAVEAVHYLAFFDPYYPENPEKPRHFKVNYFNRRKQVAHNGQELWLCHKSPQGVMQGFSRKCIDTVGFFDENFGRYGMEHHDYWQRTCSAGFSPSDHFYDVKNSSELLKIDWGQPESFSPEEKKTVYKESESWRKELFEQSKLGFSRIKVEEPSTGYSIVREGPKDPPPIKLSAKGSKGLLKKDHWVYKDRLPVLAYHAVAEDRSDRFAVQPELFKAQIEALSAELRFITTQQALQIWRRQGAFDEGLALLTFDDGYEDLLSLLPFFEQVEVRSTIFIPAKWIGGSNSWDRGAYSVRNHLNWEQIEELSANGHEIGSHGWDHCSLAKLGDHELEFELQHSKAALHKHLGQPISAIAYPFGRLNDKVLAMASRFYEVGFVAGRGGQTGWSNSPFAIRRITVSQDDSVESLLGKINDYMMETPVHEPVWYRSANRGPEKPE